MKLYNKFDEDSDDEDEQMLFAIKFKGHSNKCGKPFEFDGKFKGHSNKCGKFGHGVKDCYLKPNNENEKDKRRWFSGK